MDDAHFFFSFASDPDHVVAKCSVMNLSSYSATLAWSVTQPICYISLPSDDILVLSVMLSDVGVEGVAGSALISLQSAR